MPSLELDQDEPIPPSLISVATGADVTLTLSGGAGCDGLAAGCLNERPDTILKVELAKGGNVELGTVALETNDDIRVDILALKPGTQKLRVNYVDRLGDEHRDEVKIRVADIDRVELAVACEEAGHSGDVYPVSRDSSVLFRHDSFDTEGNQLATGRMEVVESFGGFVAPDPPAADGELRTAVAPSGDGEHTWDLVGPASPGPRFVVFPAGQFDLEVSEASTGLYPSGVRVGRIVGGAPLCVHDGDSRATLEVVSGACLPLVGEMEISTPVPLGLEEGAVELGLSGQGSCEVLAAVPGGPSASLQLDVNNLVPPPKPGTGTVLATDPIPVGGTIEPQGGCNATKNLSNGNCEIIDAAGFILPDADCLYDVRWIKNHYDRGEKLKNAEVGVGLVSELRVKIEYELIGFIPFGTYSPNNLVVTPNPPGVQFESYGCNDSDAEVLGVVAEAEADFELELKADNAFNATTFTLRGRTVAKTVPDFGVTEVASGAGGVDAWFFVGNDADVALEYQGAGGAPLYGTAPIFVSTDDPSAGATVSPLGVETGVAPNNISLATDVTADVHVIHVVDGDTVGGIGGFGAKQIPVGGMECIEAYPTEPGGTRIHGDSPIRPRLAMTGDDTMVFDLTLAFANMVCLRGVDPGSTDLELSWGTAAQQQTWTVQ